MDYRRQEPHPYVKEINSKWFTPKFKSAGYRYEVASSVKRGDICWFNGPFPCGLMNDLRIFRLSLKSLLRPEEQVIADKGYRGDSKTCTPLDAKNRDHSRAMGVARARHETLNRRFKQWGALQGIWRHEDKKHGLVFRSVATITQLEISNGRPLFHCEGYEDQVLG